MNLVLENTELGVIKAPSVFIDALDDAMLAKIESSFKLALSYSPSVELAWGHAVNNVYAAWKGMNQILNQMKN